MCHFELSNQQAKVKYVLQIGLAIMLKITAVVQINAKHYHLTKSEEP